MAELKIQIAPFLKDALFSPVKHVSIAAGRRTGKTWNSAGWLCIEKLSKPNSSGLWVDTRQQNIQRYIDRYFLTILKPIWHKMKYDRNKQSLVFPNGSYIDFGSAERPERLEGFGYDDAVLNESGIILRKAELWDNTLQPMLKGQNTKVRLIGTPKGRNKFRDLYSKGKTKTDGYESYKFNIYDSPFYSKHEIEDIKNNVPEIVWKQEYMAEFVEGAGIVFRHIQDNIGHRLYQQGDRNNRYFMAIDLAKHVDFTVIMIADKQRRVVYFDRFNQIDWGLQKQRILDAYKRFNSPYTIIDSTGVGDAIYDDLKNAGMNVTPFKFTNSTKDEIIRNLSVALDNNNITYPEIPELIEELELFEYDKKPSGLITYNAPDGFHDDCVIALALLNEILEERAGVAGSGKLMVADGEFTFPDNY